MTTGETTRSPADGPTYGATRPDQRSGAGRGYDRLAPVYALLERLAFGGALDRARRAHASALADTDRILVAGAGDGRFVAELARRHPRARIVALDASRGMLRTARMRVPRSARVRFRHADLRSLEPERHGYDAITANFVLDQFGPLQVETIVQRLAAALRPGGTLLHTDFALPNAGWRRARATAWLRILYAFFGAMTDLPARELFPARPALERTGLVLEARTVTQHGLLASARYRKPENPSGVR